MVKEERTDYAQRIILAKRRPDLYLNLTIDGSDNSAYGFPYFSERNHNTSKGFKVRSKLYAAILHGHFGAAFTYATNLKGGSVVTVEIIHRMLELFLKDKPGNRLPPTLWIQLDNTCRDNKNRFVFGYIQSLVDMGLFREVEVNFLPVGHTHCDIDQLFSRVSVHLYVNNCFSFNDLLRKAQLACRLIKYTARLYGFANWKNHAEIHKLLDDGEFFKRFTSNRQFRFVRAEKRSPTGSLLDFTTMVQCRANVFHSEWVDLEGRIGVSIPLSKKKLSFENVFGMKDLSTLNYVAHKVSHDPVKKKNPIREMQIGVLNSQQRLVEMLGYQTGMQVVNGLLGEIERQTQDQPIPFSWDLSMYRNPLTNWDSNTPFFPAVSARSDALLAVREEAERITRFEDAGGSIDYEFTNCRVGDYVIVCANTKEDSLKRPFWVGQICDNAPDKNKLKVHWLLPPTTQTIITPKSGKSYPAGEPVGEGGMLQTNRTRVGLPVVKRFYVSPSSPPKARANKPQKPNQLCVIKHYPYATFRAVLDVNSNKKSHSMKGQRAVVKKTFWIPYDSIFFAFRHLTRDSRLPSAVLDAISEEPEIDWMG
jgi:hypothetical protein